MISIRLLTVLFFFNLFFSTHLNALVKGSESVVSVEAQPTFPAVDNDNTMLGFGWFKNGFILADNATTCTFDSVYPVSGTVNMNGGTLHLSQDLVFQNNTTLQELGSIYGYDHMLALCATITHIPPKTVMLDAITLDIREPVTIEGVVEFQGDCTLNGNDHDITFGSNAAFVVKPNSHLTLQNIKLEHVSGGQIQCTDNSGLLTFDNVVLIQDGHYTFSLGSFTVRHTFDCVGSYSFIYASDYTTTIEADARWILEDDICLTIGRTKSDGGSEPLYFATGSSSLEFDKSSLVVTSSGMQLTRGQFVFDRDVTLDIVGTTTPYGLVQGGGIAADDFVFHFNSGAQLSFKSGMFVYNNSTPDGFQASSETARILRYGDSSAYIQKDWTFPKMVLKVAEGNPVTIVPEGSQFGYEQTSLILSGIEFDITGRQSGSNTFFLDGGDSFFLGKGVFPLPFTISGTGNTLLGNGNISGGVTLQDNASEVTWDINGFLDNDVALQGGTFILGGDLHLGSSSQMTGTGKVNIGQYRLATGVQDNAWTGTLEWIGNEGIIDLKARLHLKGTWTFTGNTIVNGRGNILDTNGVGKIVVGSNAKVTFRDIVLQDLSGDDISCVDSSSELVLDNVIWIQDGNINFDQGKLSIVNQVDFVGSYTFAYASSQTSTIQLYSQWSFNKDMFVKMGRYKATNYVEPVCFAGESSTMLFDGASLLVTGSGMQVTNGRLVFDDEVYLDVASTTTTHGLMFGNGVEANDIHVHYNPGARFHFRSGCIVYNNIGSNAFTASSKTAHILRYGASKAYIMQDWLFPPMKLEVAEGSPTTIVTNGASFGYKDTRLLFSSIEFDITGDQSASNTFFLDGNDSLFIGKGFFPLPLQVSGTGNQIRGNGNMLGSITLQDAASEIQFDLNGLQQEDVLLNGGALVLNSDLRLGSDVAFTGSGSVNIGTHQLMFGTHDLVWTSTIEWSGTNASLDLESQISLASTWTFSGASIINGNGQTITMCETGNIVVTQGSTLTLRNLTLKAIKNDSICCVDDSASLILDNVRWIQEADVTFAQGSFEFKNTVDFTGSYTFAYDSHRSSTISQDSSWALKGGIHLCIGRKKAIDYVEPLIMTDQTSIIMFDEASLRVTSTGWELTKGTLIFDKEVTMDIDGTTTQHGFSFGNGVSEDDLHVHFNSGAVLHFKSGWCVHNIVQPNLFTASSKNAHVMRYGASKAYIPHDWLFPSMKLEVAEGSPTTLVADGVTFGYKNTRLIFSTIEFDITGDQSGSNSFLLNGNDSLFITKGVFPLPLAVSGASNVIKGSGSMGGAVTLSDSSSDVHFDLQGLVLQNIDLNGGSIVLDSNMHMASGVTINGEGSVNLGMYACNIGHNELLWTGTTLWSGTNGSIVLNAPFDLSGTWTISGTCIINGNGNTLTLKEQGALVVDSNSHLTLQNIRLSGIADHNVCCLDADASIVLDDTIWLQDADYSFTVGSLEFKNTNKLFGSSKFVYSSGRTSTIITHARLILDGGMTFSYDPATVASKDLLLFEDSTSEMKFNGSSLHATVTGMNLRKGKISIKGECCFLADTQFIDEQTEINEGITFGTGVAEQDCTVRIEHGSMLACAKGSIIYNNVSAPSWSMGNALSSLHMHADTALKINKTLNLGLGVLQLSGGALLDVAPGYDIVGSVFIVE